MPVNEPDFSKCGEKKCSTSAGVIFNCDNPCEGGALFDYTTGTCEGDSACPCDGDGSIIKVYGDESPDPLYAYNNVEQFTYIGEELTEVDGNTTSVDILWLVKLCDDAEAFVAGHYCGTTDSQSCSEDDFSHTQECPPT